MRGLRQRHYTGIVVHDHLKACLRYTDFLCGLCNAYRLRELAFLLERGQLAWAGEKSRLLVVMSKCVDRARRRQQTVLSPALHRLLSQCYDAVVESGIKQGCRLQPALAPSATGPKPRGRRKKSKAKNLLDRLKDFKTETLRFTEDFRVSFDNNLAERDIRMVKLKQKISCAFRSQNGASPVLHDSGLCVFRQNIKPQRVRRLGFMFSRSPFELGGGLSSYFFGSSCIWGLIKDRRNAQKAT